MKKPARTPSRTLVPSEPAPDHPLRHSQLRPGPLLREPKADHGQPKQSRALRHVRAKPVHEDSGEHLSGPGWCEVATLSSTSAKTADTMSGEDADVGDRRGQRSEKYRAAAETAGLEIKLARSRAGWSQEQLAQKARLNKSDISRFENGELLEMSVGRFFDMCEALSLDPVYVWTGKTRRDVADGRRAERIPMHSEPPSASHKRPSSKPKRA